MSEELLRLTNRLNFIARVIRGEALRQLWHGGDGRELGVQAQEAQKILDAIIANVKGAN